MEFILYCLPTLICHFPPARTMFRCVLESFVPRPWGEEPCRGDDGDSDRHRGARRHPSDTTQPS